ncbi:hypothetical protein H6G74_17430 [Nostoc spongiaeforme FACHB-130]|uniref:Uncharacterized protein n=1 Tax=Nostoc spongiaeforme FACHB-130 TaxID=1357510 RepID=A0ABR8FZH7_9NOSO|nr:hypothetical protein [Nostoc spongiaeforme]MBD2596095.1 hypothetical protein [Nostoc spongiaeforme FACHB-130]
MTQLQQSAQSTLEQYLRDENLNQTIRSQPTQPPDWCRLGGGTEPNIHAYFVGLRYRYIQPYYSLN